jgi:nucleoside-diphosphate-sugar epimerase
LVAGVDVVIHAAGLAHQHRATLAQRVEYSQINTACTESMVRAAVAADCQRFVLVSSVSVYGAGSPATTEEAPCNPSSPYAISKLEAEHVASEVAASSKMELIILRMATLYGDNDPGNVGRLLRTIDRGRFLWIGDGQNRKSLVHVEDAASACALAATRPLSTHFRTFNIATEPCTMREIVSTLACSLGRRPPSIHVPARIPLTAAAITSNIPGLATRARRFRSTLDKWLSDEVFDATLFRDTFGWHPKISLDRGLARQVAQYRLNWQQASPTSTASGDGRRSLPGNRAA